MVVDVHLKITVRSYDFSGQLSERELAEIGQEVLREVMIEASETGLDEFHPYEHVSVDYKATELVETS